MVTTDNPTVNTELNTTSMLTFNVDAANFTGSATVVASVINPTTQAVIPGWTVTVANPTMNITADGITPVVATLTIPSQSTDLTAAVKFDVTSSLGTQSATSTITALNQVTLTVTANGNQCVYPASVTVKTGTKVRFLNKTSFQNFIIHGDNGIPHGDTGNPIAENNAYEITPNAPVANGSWYCHSPGPNLNQNNVNNNPKVVVVQ